jgi:hypothetical protein
MTLIEAGVIAGIPTGAIIGAVLCKSHSPLGIVGGSFAGSVSGAAAGYLYAFLVMSLLSVVGVLWRAARKRADTVHTEADMKLMTPIGNRGIIMGSLIALICWFSFDWLHAVAAALLIGLATAIIAIARCELR